MRTANAAMKSAAPMNVFFLSTLLEVMRRHGVVAARVQRRALEHAERGEPGAPEGPVRRHGLGGIVRAGRVEAAAAGRAEYHGKHRRGRPLVDADEPDCGGRGEAR